VAHVFRRREILGGRGRDFAKRSEVASYPLPRGVARVSLSPDGRRIAISCWGGEIWLREVGGAELMHEKFDTHMRLTFSPDGNLLVGVTERSNLRTWDGHTGELLEKDAGGFRGGTFPFWGAIFSPDGKYMVTYGGKMKEHNGVKFAVWSMASRKQLYKKNVDLDRIFSASISPDSKTLATSGENSVALWDLETGARRTETDDTGGQVYYVNFSPDGKLLASASFGVSNVAKLWNPSTGRALGLLKGNERDVRSVVFTRDGKTAITGGQDQSVRVFDLATLEQTGMLQGTETPNAAGAATPLLAVALSHKGDRVATGGEDGQVRLYGPAPQGLTRSWAGHEDAIAAIAYSPDGKTLVTGGYDKTIRFWNPDTGEQIRSLGGHNGWVVSLAFSHDGQTLASGSYDRTVRLWNVSDGTERETLTGHTATIRSLAFSDDDKQLASGGADHTVRLWDPATGQALATLAGHEAGVRSVAFSPAGRLLASAGEDQAIKVWNATTHDLRGTLTGHADMVTGVAFVGETLVSTGWDRSLRTWDAEALEPRSKLTAGNSEVLALAVSAGGERLLTAGADQSLTFWKSTSAAGRRSGTLGEYRTFSWSAAFSPNGANVAVAVGGFEEESDLYLYDPVTKAEKYKVTFPDNLRSIAFSPAGDLLALSFADKRVLLVDAAAGTEVAQLEDAPAEVPEVLHARFGHVTFSPDGKWVAASDNGEDIRVYDVAERKLIKTLKGSKDRVLSFAFAPHRNELVSCTAGNKMPVVWDLEESGRRYTLPKLAGLDGVASVSYSPDGKLLATGFNKNACCLWNAETGTFLKRFEAHQGTVFEVAFTPDGKLLATAGEDGLVKLWDVASGRMVRSYTCESGKVLCLHFSPDGKSFVTSGREGQVRLWWVLPPEEEPSS